jgi:hypothetical protein
MSADWAKRLTRWWPHIHPGGSHSLAHLHPFRFSIELPKSQHYPARAVEIRVGFSCHTFTRTIEPSDAAEHLYATPRETRTFCPERYQLSHLLQDIVRELPERKCYYANQDNYFVIETHELLATDQEYRVFFDVRPVGVPDAVLLFVQSAYVANKSKGGPHGITRKKVGFRVLVSHALKGTKPVRPP